MASTTPSWFVSAVSYNNVNDIDNLNTSSGYNTYKTIQNNNNNNNNNGFALKTMVRHHTSKQQVKFDDRKEAEVVHQLESLGGDSKQLWFTKREIKALRAQGRSIIDKVNQAGGDLSTLDEANGEIIRGLEFGLNNFDREGLAIPSNIDDRGVLRSTPLCRRKRSKNIVQTILSQQQEQRQAGIDDPKGLQVTSKACTQWARERAIDQAVKDFQDAVEIYRQDEYCTTLLPSVLEKKHNYYGTTKKTSLLTTIPTPLSKNLNTPPRNSQATLDNINRSLASALEELDDLDLDF